MGNKKLQFHYFIGLLLLVSVLAIMLYWPFVAPLAVAFMTAILVRPMYRRILKGFRGRETLASIVTVIIVLIVVLVPLSILTGEFTVETYSFLVAGGQDGLTSFASDVVRPIHDMFPLFNPDVNGFVSSFTQSLIGNARGIFTGTASFALGVFISVISLFYMLRDGHRFKKAIIELSPLADAYDEEILEKIERAVNSVIRGNLFISLVRGVLTAIGFAFFGVPHPILWGAATAVISLLPGIGMLLTLIPAVLYLLSTGNVGSAIGLSAWGIVVISSIDNIVMPFVIGKGFTVHPLWVLLSVLGGLIFFGPVGLLLGPLVIALLSALLEIYKLVVIDEAKGAEGYLR